MYAATKDDNISTLKNSNLQATVNEAQNDLRDAANKAGHKVRDIINTASDELSHAKDNVAAQIRTNPLQSGMVVLGVGFVLGLLFRR